MSKQFHVLEAIFRLLGKRSKEHVLNFIWQIGNEPNLYLEWDGDLLSAAAYVEMFVPIREAITSVSSPLGEQIVLLGPVSPGEVIGGVRHTAGNDYLGQMCDLLTADDIKAHNEDPANRFNVCTEKFMMTVTDGEFKYTIPPHSIVSFRMFRHPNLLGTIALSPRVASATKDYLARLRRGEFYQKA